MIFLLFLIRKQESRWVGRFSPPRRRYHPAASHRACHGKTAGLFYTLLWENLFVLVIVRLA
jgi:hypothetical protein